MALSRSNNVNITDNYASNPALTNERKHSRSFVGMKENSHITLFNGVIDVGDSISVVTPEGIRYFTKLDYDGYMNPVTGELLTARNIVGNMVNDQWHIISKRAMLGKLDTMGVLKSRTKHIEMDIETDYFKFNKYDPNMKHVGQLAWANIDPNAGTTKSTTNVLLWEHLRDQLSVEQEGPIKKLKWNATGGKLNADNFMKNFKARATFNEDVQQSYADVLKYIDQKIFTDSPDKTLESNLIDMVDGKKGYIDFNMKPGQQTVLGTTDGIGHYMRGVAGEWQQGIRAGKMSAWSFNPSGVDQSVLNTLLKTEAGQSPIEINLGDSRRLALMQRAMQYPGTGMEFYLTNSSLITPIMDKLGIAGKARNEIVDNIIRGPSSPRAKASTVEDFYNYLSDINGKKQVKESHEALSDVMMTSDLLQDNVKLTKKIVDNIHEPDIPMGPRTRSRFAYLKQLFYRNLSETSSGQEYLKQRKIFNPGAFSSFFDDQTGLQRIKHTVERMTLDDADKTFRRTLLGDTRTQFGGGTISTFLAGALGAGLIAWSVNKARSRIFNDERSEPEGLSHNSLSTVIRRLQLTDFGSARVPSNWTSASLAMIKSVFTESRQRGLGKNIDNLLTGISDVIKHGLTATDAAKYELGKKKAWAASRRIGNKFYNLIFHGSEAGESIKTNIKETIKSSGDLLKKMNINKNPRLFKDISESLMQKWIDVPATTKGIVGAGLAVGVGGSILIDTMKGNYDPNYDYKDYIDEGQDTPRNYKRNLKAIRSTRRLKDSLNTAFRGESMFRTRERYENGDFGSGIRSLIHGMHSRFVGFWGPARGSMDDVFHSTWLSKVRSANQGLGDDLYKSARVFDDNAVAKVAGPLTNADSIANNWSKNVPRSIDKVSRNVVDDYTNRAAATMNKIATDTVPRMPNQYTRYVSPPHLTQPANQKLVRKSRVKGAIVDNVDAMTPRSKYDTSPILSEARANSAKNYNRKVTGGNYNPVYTHTTGDIHHSRFADSIETKPISGISDNIMLPRNVIKRPKDIRRSLKHSKNKAFHEVSKNRVSDTRSMMDDVVNKQTMSKPYASTLDWEDTMSIVDVPDKSSQFISKGDASLLSKFKSDRAVPTGVRYINKPNYNNGAMKSFKKASADGYRAELNEVANNVTVDYSKQFGDNLTTIGVGKGARTYGGSLGPYSSHSPGSFLKSSLFNSPQLSYTI